MNSNSNERIVTARRCWKAVGLSLGLGFLSGLGGPGLTNHPDERVNSTIQRWASIAGWVARTALGIDLLVRALVLRQDVHQYWDIGLIWLAAMMLSSIGMVRSGVQPVGAVGRWSWKTSGLIILIIALLVPAELWLLGQIDSVTAYLACTALAVAGGFVMHIIIRGVYSRWERRTLGDGPGE